MTQLDEQDWKLSMKTSYRALADEQNQGLRTLLVHRLTSTLKAISRLSLRTNICSVFCEACQRWVRVRSEKAFLVEWTCPSCHRLYQMEYAVYEEVEQDGEDERGNDGLPPGQA